MEHPENIVITPLIWTILTFIILQLLAGIKFINGLYSKISILEIEIKDIKLDFKEGFKSKDEDREKHRSLFFKELKRIEDKSDCCDKEINKRADGIAQGLVKVETRVDGIEKIVHK